MVACICTVLKDFTCIFFMSNTSMVLVYESRFTTHNMHVVNKLLSLTWLLWAPRNFWRFTLHTLKEILKLFVIQQKNTNGNIETKLLIIIPINIYIYTSIYELVEASIGRSSEAVSGPLLFISFEYPCDVSQYVHDIFTSEFKTSKMLKRRSSVRNCCRIESSNRLNSIFIKFNFFIFLKYFCKGGPGPLGPPRSATAYYVFCWTCRGLSDRPFSSLKRIYCIEVNGNEFWL